MYISAVNCTDIPIPAPGTLVQPNDRGTYDWTKDNGTHYGTLIRYKYVFIEISTRKMIRMFYENKIFYAPSI